MSDDRYIECEVIREGEVICVVTDDKVRNQRTVMFAKEFMRDGKVCRTPYLAKRHLPAIARMLDLLPAKI
ncbi:MAG: hypothetical protein Q8S00_32400 [Deltaproteobacteria bacterium]|nr:hypothetical protein [Deltaproteobacteria bacterium]